MAAADVRRRQVEDLVQIRRGPLIERQPNQHGRPESVDLVGIIDGEVTYRDRDDIRAYDAAMRFSSYNDNDETRFIFC